MLILFSIFFVLCTIAFIPLPLLDSFWVVKEWVFMFGCSLILACSFIFKRNREYYNLPIMIMLVIIMVHFCFYFMKPIVFSYGKIQWNLWCIKPTINAILGLFTFKIILESCDKNFIFKVTKMTAFMGFACSVYMLIQFLGIDPIFKNNVKWFHTNGHEVSKTYMIGFFNNKMLASQFVAVTASLFLIFKGIRYKLAYIFMLGILFLTDTTISVVALSVGLMTYFFITERWKISCVVFTASLFCIFILNRIYPDFINDTGRYELWVNIIKYSIEQNTILFGNGWGSFAHIGFISGNKNAISAHNEFIQFLSDGGIVFVGVFIWYLLDLFMRIKSFLSNKTAIFVGYVCALASYMVVLIFSFPLRIASLALLGIIILFCLEYTLIEGESNV